ncbi:MAG: ABC transporter ATP-binding protein [Planctomycetes bacterium]|nr:ABC transporter ATP-binding protein [Planctomycetota bacterium]
MIRIRGLTKLYRMGESIVRALDGVDLEIHPGEFLAITGASGSGKSTMMHLLGCLDRPTGGEYWLNGRNVSELNDGELADIRNREIGFVFQTFNLINRTTALDNVGVPLFYARKGNTRGPAQKALERVGLGQRSGHRPNELSGGERQRVAIARAIVNEPKFLLADEPTGNLDSRTGEQIMQIFHDLSAQGVTIVLVTHEPDVAMQARRIVQMRDGKIVSDRLTEDIRRDSGALPVSGQGAYLSAAAPPIQAAETAAAARPAAAAPVQSAQEAPNGYDESKLIARMAPGATGTLMCGIIAAVGAVVAMVCGILAQNMMPRDLAPGTLPPTPALVAGLASVVGLLLAIVVGLIAFFYGRSVKRRIANEPGCWVGAWRAKLGGWIGLGSALLPFVPGLVRLGSSAFKG